jgi:hypothetical protein
MAVTQQAFLSVLSSEHIATYCGYLADFDSALLVYVSTSEEVDRPTELVELVGEHFILTGRLPVRKESKV